jgi:exopolyphosphatase / guanosine-5'-triphosphate,3'-diphosphate pyrophosphatase
MRVGIIDLGTNSLRVAVYELGRRKNKCIYKKKHMLRVGDGVFTAGLLKPSTRKRITQALNRFATRAQKMGVEYIEAVATSALREAKNRRAIVRNIREKTGIDLKIITGNQEARLIAEGILDNDTLSHEPHILIDIGGGSTELSWVLRRQRKRSTSLPLGALRMQQCFFPQGHNVGIKKRLEATRSMRRHIEAILSRSQTPPWGAGAKAKMIGSSGTIRALARMLQPPTKPWSKPVRQKLTIKREDLAELVQLMLHLNRSQLLRLPAMDPRRADIILPGAILLLETMIILNVEILKTSDFALRDGLIGRAHSLINRQKIT